ncbi:hypothetical protein ACFL35_15935 [Candidatus Riflebacteria bacterium]
MNLYTPLDRTVLMKRVLMIRRILIFYFLCAGNLSLFADEKGAKKPFKGNFQLPGRHNFIQKPFNPANPYPGGSPFPPGHEPSLTHTARIFWLTGGPVDKTIIHLKAEGSRPSQIDCFQNTEDGKTRGRVIFASIYPESKHHFIFLAKGAVYERKGSERVIKHTGSGVMEIRVYGFSASDFKIPPRLTALYYSGNRKLGETELKMHPIPNKLLNKVIK